MGATSDKIIGKGKQIEGKLTGDKLRMAEGTAQKKKGDIEGAASRLARDVKAGVRSVRRSISRAVRSTRR